MRFLLPLARRVSPSQDGQIGNVDMGESWPVFGCKPPVQTDPASLLSARLRYSANGDSVSRNVSFRGPDGEVGNRDCYTHQFHRYPAKLFWKIPSVVLDTMCPGKGSVVLDPFCGSGTVMVEALARNCVAIGCDTNPIARRLSFAKTTPLCEKRLTAELARIARTAKRLRRQPPTERLPTFWFTNEARCALYRIWEAIQLHVGDDAYRNFFEVTLTSIVRECSLADPAIPPPVRLSRERAQLAGPRYQRALGRALALRRVDVYRKFEEKASRNVERLCGFLTPGNDAGRVLNASALTTGLPDKAIDIVVTSPPYFGGAQKYTRTFRLELKILGYSDSDIRAIDRRDIGTERSHPGPPADLPDALSKQQRELICAVKQRNQQRWRLLTRYLQSLGQFAHEVKRVVKPEGHAVICLGVSHVAGLSIDMSEFFVSLARDERLQLIARFRDHIPSRGLITKRHETASLIGADDVLVFRRV